MGLKEFWKLLEKEPVKSLSTEAILLPAVSVQILAQTGAKFYKDPYKINERKLKKFFLQVLDDISKEVGEQLLNNPDVKKRIIDFGENTTINIWKKDAASFLDTLRKWKRNNSQGVRDQAILVYYWFHAYEEKDKPYAIGIDRALSIDKLFDDPEFKEKFDKAILPPSEIVDTSTEEDTNKNIQEGTGQSVPVTECSNTTTNEQLSDEQVAVEGDSDKPDNSTAFIDKTIHKVYSNPFEIPFFGRKKELEALNSFAKDNRPFLTWAIVGAAGSGKTSLYNAWLYNEYDESFKASAVYNWHKIVITPKHDDSKKIDWPFWRPKNNTIIVIDYLLGFGNTFTAIMDRLQDLYPTNKSEALCHKVRVLIVDRTLPENQINLNMYMRWNVRPYLNISPIYKHPKPLTSENGNKTSAYLELNGMDDNDQKDIIKRIIRHVAGKKVSTENIKEAMEFVTKISVKSQDDGRFVGHPLFASLVGYAIKQGKNYKSLSKMELIDYLFDKNDVRLPWHLNSIEGQVASTYISAATARRGMKYNVLEKSVQTNTSEPQLDKVVLLCQAIVASKDEEFLPAFEPDIIGETYFLAFLHDVACQKIDKDIRVSFDRMLASGDIKQQALDAMQLVKFLKQLGSGLVDYGFTR
jgi:hypothetical protein